MSDPHRRYVVRADSGFSSGSFLSAIEEAPLMHHCYGNRGECENWIEAVKNHLGQAPTLVDHFWANALSWQLAGLAYNLSVWLRLLTDRKTWRARPAIFRRWFIHCTGKLVGRARRYVLKTQAGY